MADYTGMAIMIIIPRCIFGLSFVWRILILHFVAGKRSSVEFDLLDVFISFKLLSSFN